MRVVIIVGHQMQIACTLMAPTTAFHAELTHPQRV